MKTVQLIITGMVQGVFYRATAKKIAERLNLTGWIKNTSEGNVEVIVSGAEKQIEEFLEWCKIGPEKAKVDKVILTEKEKEIFITFNIRH